MLAVLLSFHADILVVTEFRAGDIGSTLLRALADQGYHASHPPLEPSKNSVLVASRMPITAAAPLDAGLADHCHLWQVKTNGLDVVGVYMPLGAAKTPYWQAVLRVASDTDRPSLFIGDFNTSTNTLDKDPNGAAFVSAAFMDRIVAAGFVDLWRTRHPLEREYAWFSPQGRNGFRLDHAFSSPLLCGTVITCDYEHHVRLEDMSDHSAMVLVTERPQTTERPEFFAG